ncbi:hypothetical protein BCU44_08015 [Vibrio cyclitrophicus]|nr:hypothetical protein OA9_13510 [Vibrio cyclitrophicus 1F97]PMI46522.1 hypothetical protein BCU44_08015 [Vibrio cyclitrophicus]
MKSIYPVLLSASFPNTQIITSHMHGGAVLAMILNGLGFHSRTLHMLSDFFETKPVAKLF